MRAVFAVCTAALSILVFSGYAVGADPTPSPSDYGLGKIALEDVTTENGFRYFSGNYFSGNMSTSNNPAMFAGFANGVWSISVVGPGYYQEFGLKDVEKAFRAYKALLVVRGYDLPPD